MRMMFFMVNIESLVEPVAKACGVELYDLEYVKEGGDRILRLFIDKEGGVDLNDCERVSRAVEVVLDEHDPIPNAYRLQVGSPGIDRKLVKPEHFTRYIGEKISLRLFAPHAPKDETQAESITTGRKKFTGILSGYELGTIKLTDADKVEWIFEQNQVSSCKLDPNIMQGGTHG